MIDYHDVEWGMPVTEDRALFEMLTLEGAQAGLSWKTILNKREGYRRLFANFEPAKVARFTPARRDKLMQDAGIVRNRAKIESTVLNAKIVLELQREYGSLAHYLWDFVEGKPLVNTHQTPDQRPAKTELSDTISKALKKRGMKFVGSTIVYSFLQAAGMVNDHAADCFARRKCIAAGKKIRAQLAR